ncbi:Zinc finger CGNR domain-containing protein OS=Streptomyces glaucescens OX=1907 GN=SGLAU_13875 PE=4 SV=1 [Streptomyces glaucescens]
MNERLPAPGGLALVEALVNTVDLESGRDVCDTPQARERFGIAEGDLDAVRELRESLRATCLAHAGHPPHRPVTPLGDLLARTPLYVAVDPRDGSAPSRPPRTGRCSPGSPRPWRRRSPRAPGSG